MGCLCFESEDGSATIVFHFPFWGWWFNFLGTKFPKYSSRWWSNLFGVAPFTLINFDYLYKFRFFRVRFVPACVRSLLASTWLRFRFDLWLLLSNYLIISSSSGWPVWCWTFISTIFGIFNPTFLPHYWAYCSPAWAWHSRSECCEWVSGRFA